MKKQKDAVYQAVTSVLAESGKSHEDGQVATLNESERKQVISILANGFENGEIELKSQQESLTTYSGGLLSNWLRKDKRLNGDVTYQAKNPGSRTGQSDPMVKNLRILINTLPEGSEARSAAEDKLEARVAEIKAERAKKKGQEVDMSVIPEDIKALLD